MYYQPLLPQEGPKLLLQATNCSGADLQRNHPGYLLLVVYIPGFIDGVCNKELATRTLSYIARLGHEFQLMKM